MNSCKLVTLRRRHLGEGVGPDGWQLGKKNDEGEFVTQDRFEGAPSYHTRRL